MSTYSSEMKYTHTTNDFFAKDKLSEQEYDERDGDCGSLDVVVAATWKSGSGVFAA